MMTDGGSDSCIERRPSHALTTNPVENETGSPPAVTRRSPEATPRYSSTFAKALKSNYQGGERHSSLAFRSHVNQWVVSS